MEPVCQPGLQARFMVFQFRVTDPDLLESEFFTPLLDSGSQIGQLTG
jgi:hypothetical protein